MNHPFVRDPGCLEDAGILPVTQGNDAICDALNLAQTMRYIKNAHILAAQLAHDLKKSLRFGQSQTRRRLVHQEDPGIQRQRPRNLDHLALRQRKLLDACPR